MASGSTHLAKLGAFTGCQLDPKSLLCYFCASCQPGYSSKGSLWPTKGKMGRFLLMSRHHFQGLHGQALVRQVTTELPPSSRLLASLPDTERDECRSNRAK